MSTTEPRRDPYQSVTNLIIEHLELGTVPWRCPWQREIGMPRNFHTGKSYSGINVLLLGMRHQPSPYWLTFRQALERGGNVRKGEKGSLVVKYGQFQPKGLAVKEEQTDDPKQKKRMFLREYTVFNASQIDGIDFPAMSTTQAMNKDERIAVAEKIVTGMPNPPAIREGLRACYSPATDMVTMPPFGSFESADKFYLTLYHEICHASGHASRLNRESLVKHDEFGGPVYSQEELVAEMGAAFLGLEADIVRDQHEQSAAYLQSWLDVLRVTEHKRWIVNAAAQATKAVDYVLDRQAVMAA